jgi:16S rRNA processing protein RimM
VCSSDLNGNVILKFDFVNSHSSAKDLLGCKLYVFKRDHAEVENPEMYPQLTGIEVIDHKRGDLGKIIRIDDYSGNVVVTVMHPNGEILIPLTDQIINRIDNENKKLYLTCPEGLIDLYIE